MIIKRTILILFSFIFILLFTSCSEMQVEKSIETTQSVETIQDIEVQNDSASNEPDPKKEGDTELFAEIANAHGIVFDNQGNMFISQKGTEILKVTPDADTSLFASIESLEDKTDKTHIWSMTLGKDHNIYAAANDRIIKITMDGKMQNLVKESYTGEWGACDIKFDEFGYMYIAHGTKVEKYDLSLKKSTIIDGENDVESLSSVVGIEFSPDYKSLYIGDVFGNKVVRYSINEGVITGDPFVIPNLRAPEYIAADKSGNAFVSLPGGGGLAKINPDGTVTLIDCENKLLEPTTLAFGKKGFKEDSIYVMSKGQIFTVYVESN